MFLAMQVLDFPAGGRGFPLVHIIITSTIISKLKFNDITEDNNSVLIFVNVSVQT